MFAVMKTITAEVVDTGQVRDKRGRKIVRAEERAALLAAYATSGLTQRAFAEREGVKYCTFTMWLAKQRKAGPGPKVAFARVDLNGGRMAAAMEVVLPDGVVVRGNTVEQVLALVAQLRRC